MDEQWNEPAYRYALEHRYVFENWHPEDLEMFVGGEYTRGAGNGDR